MITKNFTKRLQKEQDQFHTTKRKFEKLFKLVLRGVSTEVTTNEVEKYLTRMEGKNVPYPLVLIEISKEYKSSLVAGGLKIEVEALRKRANVVQCQL